MARKSIFELLAEGDSLSKNTERLVRYFEEETVVCRAMQDYTLKDYVDTYSFEGWESRGNCIDVDDFLESMGYSLIVGRAEFDPEAFLILVELVFNFWKIVANELQAKNAMVKHYRIFYNAKEFLINCLSKYNHTALYYEDEQQVLVVEDKREVTAVAEVVEPQLAKAVIRYNHRSLQGDIEAKKSILLSMGAELEPLRGSMNTKDKDNEDLIFFMLNNMNLRHNNVTEGDSKYKEGVALMPEEELEGWYDELYQMMLLAFLQLDNKERIERVKELKKQICSK